ncbi:hypothetical protein [Flavonifractor plautii]|uniref:hypothetical protein n=1 Tax=Flavonifractor plautii TaxID=292800 RepID=UPI0019599D81|nr:hypothetical protein [Flavonifractor plautii]MBM6663642.1 hypothetical protein [Flavonifractor plautii]
MRFVLRMIAFPFAALCTVLAAVVGLVSGISEVLLELLGGLCLLCALFAWFIQGSGSNGLFLLGIAVFFVALGLLADAIVDGLSTLAGSLWSMVRG